MSEPTSAFDISTLGGRLRTLAVWFDVYDDKRAFTGKRDVQESLRADAGRTERMERALREIIADTHPHSRIGAIAREALAPSTDTKGE